jgi:hypothetical protein
MLASICNRLLSTKASPNGAEPCNDDVRVHAPIDASTTMTFARNLKANVNGDRMVIPSVAPVKGNRERAQTACIKTCEEYYPQGLDGVASPGFEKERKHGTQ